MNLVTRVASFLRSALTKKRLVSALIVLLGIGILFHGAPVLAQQTPVTVESEQSLTQAINANTSSVNGCTGAGGCVLAVVGFIITFIFSVISYFLSKLLVLLTGVLITFARYNKFNLAPPVQIGWVIARDIANMFFIIVLLVSAFMTIIGQSGKFHFHYSEIIPKLLTAAILVNFSKTIIMLMIDVSQVVTLTFVSAFEGTIAGNLIQGLGITQMVRLQNAPTAAQTGINVINIALAYLLSIFLLVTAVAMIILYVGYFIVRIVGLWMILIVSPFMFLADNLPGAIGGPLKSVTGDAWKKLTTFLTGGPLIGFFLWVTFATIQQTASGTNGLSGGIGFEFPPDSAIGFITQIGTAQNLAAFIVGMVMLGAGFSFATSTAGAVGLGSLAKSVTGYRDKAFNALSRSPLTIARGTGRVAGGAVRGGFNIADRRFGLTSQIASGMARGSSAPGSTGLSKVLGGAGGFAGRAIRLVPGVGGSLAVGAAGAVAARRKGLMDEEKKKVDEKMGKLDRLPPEERVAALREMRGETGIDDFIMGSALVERQHEELSKEENRKILRKQMEEEEKTRINNKIDADEAAFRANAAAFVAANPGVSTDFAARRSDVKNQATALAGRRLADDENARVQKLREYAENVADKPRIEALDKEITRRMAFSTPAKYDEQIGKMLEDHSKFKDVDPEQMKSGQFALAFLQNRGITNANGTSFDGARFDKLREDLKDQKELVQTMDLVAKQIQADLSNTANASTIQSSTRQKDFYGEQRLYSNTAGGNGEAIYSAGERAAISAIQAAPTRAAGAAFAPAHTAALDQAMKSGLPLGQIIKMMEGPVGDGMVMRELSSKLEAQVANAATSQETALQKLSELAKLARDNNASQDQRIAAISAAVSDATVVNKVFGGTNKLTGEKKKQLTSIIEELTEMESQIQKRIDADPAMATLSQADRIASLPAPERRVMQGLERLRLTIYPSEKLPANSSARFTDGSIEFLPNEVNKAPSGIGNLLY